MIRSQLRPERFDELRALIAGGASHGEAADKLDVSIGAVSWRLSVMGLKSKKAQYNIRHLKSGYAPRKGKAAEFTGAEFRYCGALDAGVPERCAAAIAGLGEGERAGIYARWKNRRGRQL